MDSPLLDELQKKDSDLRVLEQTSDGGYVVQTSLDIGVLLDEPAPPAEPAGPALSVPTLIIRHVFMLHINIVFFTLVFGLVPAHLLAPFFPASLALFLTAATCSGILCIVLAHKPHAAVFVALLLSNFVGIFSLAAVLGGSMAPFQACTIFLVEYITGLVFCLFLDKNVDPLGAAGVMMVAGLGVWALGLYSFIAEQDWLTSVILFGAGVLLAPFYWAFQIRSINRYSLKEEDLLQACINFFLDPFRWISALFAKKPQEPPSAPVDEKSTAHLLAEIEANI